MRFGAINHPQPGSRARITRYATLDRAFGTFEENHYPPTTSAVNITIVVVLRGRTIVIGDPLSILSLSRRESSEFPPPARTVS